MPSNRVPSHDAIMERIDNNTDADGECRIWNGKLFVHNNFPRFYNICIRRYLWNLSNTELGRPDVLVSSCGDHRCINIDHLEIKSREIDWDQVWERLQRNATSDGDCLIWNKDSNPDGYGISGLRGKKYTAHRLSYMVKLGGAPVPKEINGEKAAIRHLCNRNACINPEHLELGTYVENCADKIDNGTINRGEESPNVSISESLAKEIKLSRFKRGENGYKTQQSRADLFGVALSIVTCIDLGQSWAHLPDRHGNTHLDKREGINEKIRARNKRNRDQDVSPEQFANAGERLYSRVVKTDQNKKGDVEGDCWEHDGCKISGYTRFHFQGRIRLAHVWSCEISNKRQRREDEVTRHLCGNRVCVNPAHLKFGTRSENFQDAVTLGARSCKLNSENVQEIRASDLSVKELTSKYSVDRQTIANVLSRKSWKSVK